MGKPSNLARRHIEPRNEVDAVRKIFPPQVSFRQLGGARGLDRWMEASLDLDDDDETWPACGRIRGNFHLQIELSLPAHLRLTVGHDPGVSAQVGLEPFCEKPRDFAFFHRTITRLAPKIPDLWKNARVHCGLETVERCDNRILKFTGIPSRAGSNPPCQRRPRHIRAILLVGAERLFL